MRELREASPGTGVGAPPNPGLNCPCDLFAWLFFWFNSAARW